MFSMDSWLWKIAVIGAIVLTREFVRMLTVPAADASAIESAPSNNADHARGLLEIFDAIAIAFALVFFVIQPFLLQAFYIPSGSMEDTLRARPSGDRLLVAKWVYYLRGPQFGDVVVFQPPAKARAVAGVDYIKRCIGEPGDVISVQNRRYSRKARGTNTVVELQEPYVKWSPESRLYGYDMKIVGGKVYSREYSNADAPGFWQEEGAVGRDVTDVPFPPADNQGAIEAAQSEPIPADHYLVLGDHRNNSIDGHAWGLVPRSRFVGKAMCVFWPPNRVGTLDNMSEHPRPSSSAVASTRVAQ
jgi:signal peptidase I